jgi:hypothetical protein
VGFLFPHQCERLTPVGCPDCHNGSVQDPYGSRTDRQGYDRERFDSYSSNETSGWADGDDDRPAFGGGDSGGGGASMEFTEADGASLAESADRDFEDDLSAS